MVATQLEKIFYHYILNSNEYVSLTSERFFDTEVIKECYKIAIEFHEKYLKPPTRQQIDELIKIKGLEDILTREKIDIIYNVDLSTYDKVWLKDNLETWIEYKNLDTSVFDLINYLKTTSVTPENIKDVVSTAKSLILDRNNVDFKFDSGLDFFNPESHKQLESDTFSTGYPHIDLITGGGFSKKTLWVLLGQAKSGKSLWLANLAANSVRLGYNTAYISLEMRDRMVIKRLGGNLLKIKMQDYAKEGNNQQTIKEKLGNIWSENLIQPGKLYVKEYPTSSASVTDIEMYLKKMEENNGFKFKTVFVDYINIMKNWRNPNTENTYMKIKQIAEDLRAMATRNEWAVVTVTQSNRSSFDSNDMTMTHVSESAAIIHTVDAMFGIIQDPMMHAENIYILKLLANRNEGYKNSKRKFNINYDYMRITEDPNSEMWSDE